MKNKGKKLISMLLVGTLIMLAVFTQNTTNVIASNRNTSDVTSLEINKSVDEDAQVYSVMADNVTYEISKTTVGDEVQLQITQSDKPNELVLVIINNNTVKSTRKVYDGLDSQGNIKYINTIDVEENRIDSTKNIVSPLTVTWGNTVYEKLHGKYAYSVGSDGSFTCCKVIMENTSNRIRTDNLNSTNNTNYNGYISSIKTCNTKCTTAELYLGTGFIAVGVAIIATGIIAPAVLVAALIAAGVTGTATSVFAGANALIDAYSKYEDIKDYYILIKGLPMF